MSYRLTVPGQEKELRRSFTREIVPDVWMLEGYISDFFLLKPASSNVFLLRDGDSLLILDTGTYPFYRERMLETLMATATFFRPLGTEQQQEVVRLFTHERYPAGHPIIHEGARSGGFFLILLGSVEIQKRFDGERVVSLATLSEGSYFGELSLLRGDVARATVVATGPVEVARLEAKLFYTLVASNPMLWAQVWAEANRRELETLRIIAGVTGSV